MERREGGQGFTRGKGNYRVKAKKAASQKPRFNKRKSQILSSANSQKEKEERGARSFPEGRIQKRNASLQGEG